VPLHYGRGKPPMGSVRPFPRRLSPLEQSDVALGGEGVSRVSQSSVQSQAEALFERGVQMAEEAAPRTGSNVLGPYVYDAAEEFPTFVKRAMDRARQMVTRNQKQAGRPLSPAMWERPAPLSDDWLQWRRASPDATLPVR